jgi:hypothetical protein
MGSCAGSAVEHMEAVVRWEGSGGQVCAVVLT